MQVERRPDEFPAISKSSQSHNRPKLIRNCSYMYASANKYSTKMPRYLPPSVFVTICIFSLSDAFVPANKITPAEPPVGAKCTLARGSSSSRSSTTTTALNAKKKKTAPAASSKIQVKMLKHVEGTGHVRICFRHLCVTFCKNCNSFLLTSDLLQCSSLISQHCHIFSKETW